MPVSCSCRRTRSLTVCVCTAVLVSCLPIPNSTSLVSLRTLRLLKVLEVLHKMPQLAAITIGLMNAMTSVSCICCLFLLVFYLFSIMGIAMFRENDQMHFSNLHSAMITLCTIALDDWVDVMNINIYGCLSSQVHYPTPEIKALYCPDGYAGSKAFGLWAVLFFGVFICISVFIGCSLFVGVITCTMAESTKELNEQMKRKHKEKREDQFARHLAESRAKGSRLKSLVSLHHAASAFHLPSNGVGSDSEVFDQDESSPRAKPREKFCDTYERFSLRVDTLVESSGFQLLIMLFIFCGGVLVGMETYQRTEHRKDESPVWMDICHTILLVIFSVECGLKLIARGLRPHSYFFNTWNVFDLSVLLIDILSRNSMAAVLRTLRFVQVFKMMKHVPEVTLIIHGS